MPDSSLSCKIQWPPSQILFAPCCAIRKTKHVCYAVWDVGIVKIREKLVGLPNITAFRRFRLILKVRRFSNESVKDFPFSTVDHRPIFDMFLSSRI